MDQTVRCLRKYYEGVKLQTLFLYLFGVYCMFHQYSNHIQSENRKTENRKNQRYSGLYVWVSWAWSLSPCSFVAEVVYVLLY